MCYQLLAEKLTNYYRHHCLSGNHYNSLGQGKMMND
jgi:hypothetical protein